MIRQEANGAGAAVTWAEFVEAGLLRQYGRELKVPLPELRGFIDLLRVQFDVPYPLPTSARSRAVGRLCSRRRTLPGYPASSAS